MIALCQRDAYRRTLATSVAARTADGLVLEETVLYPEGGGQPADRGTIAGVAVVDVQVGDDGRIVHRTDGPPPAGLAVGAAVEVVVDWARRLDHMEQHTAQHLLTALAETHLGAATMSFHLGPETSTIELDAAALDRPAIDRLEQLARAAVGEARPVGVRFVEAADVEALGARTRGLPAGHRGPVRLVEIEGIDTSACGGTHVASTAELGAIAIVDQEAIRGRVRIHYLAGGRVTRRLAAALGGERTLGRLLSVGPAEQAAAVARLQAEVRAAGKARDRLAAELAGHVAAGLTAGPIAFLDRPEADPAFLGLVAAAADAARPDRVVVLTGGAAGGEGVFLVAGPEERVAAIGPLVAGATGGRGGGRGRRYQGRAARLVGASILAEAIG